uniref:Uncharacterized protein n=1 Tax=Anguilla anguilla TaxID=7936 RepID=A0A0E9Q6A9_ANGAN
MSQPYRQSKPLISSFPGKVMPLSFLYMVMPKGLFLLQILCSINSSV